MIRDTDIWRIGIVAARASDVLARASFDGLAIRWLPEGDLFTFLADPFALRRDGVLHLFAEAYDYRTRHGVIEVLRLDTELRIIDRRTCLAEPWHLSYPFVFESEGETWLLPEAFRSGTLTLYRAVEFPYRWEPAARLALDAPAVDATPFRHAGQWWLAYAPGHSRAARQGRLHLACADRLTGPWRCHPANPVLVDRGGARPGGSVAIVDGVPVLPVQDCAGGYGRALRPLRIERLSPEKADVRLGDPLTPPAAPDGFGDGLHTLSACGELTLIDVKRVDRSWGGRAIDVRRIARSFIGGQRGGLHA